MGTGCPKGRDRMCPLLSLEFIGNVMDDLEVYCTIILPESHPRLRYMKERRELVHFQPLRNTEAENAS